MGFDLGATCSILFNSSVGISFMTWLKFAQSSKYWSILNSRRKGLLKNVYDKNPHCIICKEIAKKVLRDTLYLKGPYHIDKIFDI